MADSVKALSEAIRQAADQYYRVVLLAGPSGSGKTASLQALSKETGYPLLNVNLELSKKLLYLARIQRARQTERLFKEVIAAVPGEVVLLDNLEVLFDTALAVEPLRLLQVSSRNRTLVAAWNGEYRDGTLTYAEPGHPESAKFKQVEVLVVATGQRPGGQNERGSP